MSNVNNLQLFLNEDPDGVIENIIENVNNLGQKVKALTSELQEYRQGTKDNETIQKLQEEISELYSRDYNMTEFSFSEKELSKIEKWEKKHYHEKHEGQMFGAIGGNYSYIIVPTSIGVVKSCKCSCGDEFIV